MNNDKRELDVIIEVVEIKVINRRSFLKGFEEVWEQNGETGLWEQILGLWNRMCSEE